MSAKTVSRTAQRKLPKAEGDYSVQKLILEIEKNNAIAREVAELAKQLTQLILRVRLDMSRLQPKRKALTFPYRS